MGSCGRFTGTTMSKSMPTRWWRKMIPSFYYSLSRQWCSLPLLRSATYGGLCMWPWELPCMESHIFSSMMYLSISDLNYFAVRKDAISKPYEGRIKCTISMSPKSTESVSACCGCHGNISKKQQSNMSLYLILNLAALAVPFVFSFHPRLKFVSEWKFFFPAVVLTGSVFIAWDILFTGMGVWSFNPEYLLGRYFMGLPLEEYLFFICIPFASVFTFHSFRKLL